MIKENCNFDYFFNNSNIRPAVVDGENEIILTNCPNEKHICFNNDNDIPVKSPSFPYVLVNRRVKCNCEVEEESHFLLETSAECLKSPSKLTM